MTEWKNPLKDEWDPKIEWEKSLSNHGFGAIHLKGRFLLIHFYSAFKL